MANTKTCIKKSCTMCKAMTRATWRYKGYNYCYPCYAKITKIYSQKETNGK